MNTVTALRVTASAVMDASLSLSCGLLLTDRWLARPVPQQRPSYRPPASLLTLVAGAFFLAAIAHLLLLTSDFSGETALRPLVRALPDTISTHAGTIACATIAATLLLLVCSSPPLRRPFGAALPTLALLLCLLLRSTSGHAAVDGNFSLSEILQAIHLAAMSLWSGGVLVSGLLVVPRLASAPPTPSQPSRTSDQVHRYLCSLSAVSTWAVLVVALSGLLKSFRAVRGDLHTLPATVWGRLLFLKLAVVAAALALGALNRRRLTTDRPWDLRATSRSVRTLRLEAWAMAAILVLSALLAGAPPPGE